MDEPNVTINGYELGDGQVMTIRAAIEHFAGELQENGLGTDAHGIRMTAGYLARITELRRLLRPADQTGATHDP